MDATDKRAAFFFVIKLPPPDYRPVKHALSLASV